MEAVENGRRLPRCPHIAEHGPTLSFGFERRLDLGSFLGRVCAADDV